ncbi:MAG: M23 family metallopeptidase [Bacteroidota bacterium]
MKNPVFGLCLLLVCLAGCSGDQRESANPSLEPIAKVTKEARLLRTRSDSVSLLFAEQPAFVATGFDYPVGKPNAKAYYNAQPFGENQHLGDDWNGTGGGNTDLGDPVFAIANGYVNFARDIGGGWGNVIRIWHQLPDKLQVESLYAHCDSIVVLPGTYVVKGQKIGTIGNCGGTYLAHLHFELRDDLSLPVGGGYAADTSGYLNPTRFIKMHR